MSSQGKAVSSHTAVGAGVLATVTLLVVAVDFAFAATTDGSVLNSPDLSVWGRLGIVSSNILATAMTVALVGVPLYCLVRNVRTKTLAAPLRLLISFGIVAAVWTMVMLYVSSWMLFRDTGQFLDHHSLRMWLANPVQMFEHIAHMRPVAVFGGPFIALAIAIVVTVILPRWRWLGEHFDNRRNVPLFRMLVLVTTCGVVFGEFVPARSWATSMDPHTGIHYKSGELYCLYRDDRAGPMVHMLADLRNLVWERDESELSWLPQFDKRRGGEPVRFIRRHQISMDEYLAGVDHSRFKRYNVIILLVESLRPDQVRAFGATREVMPNVDAIAEESFLFSNAYALASHSNYADLCPLASHYPLREDNLHLYPRNPSYPRVLIYDVLKPLGYHTAIVSSQNENWGQMLNYLDTGNLDRIAHAANYEGPTYTCPEDVGFMGWVQRGKKSGKIDDRFTVNEAIDWIRGLDDKPFCLYMNLQNSHFPYVTPPDYPRRFGPEEINFRFSYNNYPWSKASVVKDRYSDSLHYVDSQIGRFVNFLKDSGRWDNTLLAITGDTGQAFHEHGFACHGNRVYDEVMRVPLIVRAPGVQAELDDRLTSHLDVPPTVLDLLGLPPHPSFQGVSVLTPEADQDRSLLLVAQTPLAEQSAIIRSGYKLILDFRLRRFHLYDLANDPGETRDVADARPDIAQRLAERMLAWRKAQIDYYADESQHRTFYPPVIVDSAPSEKSPP